MTEKPVQQDVRIIEIQGRMIERKTNDFNNERLWQNSQEVVGIYLERHQYVHGSALTLKGQWLCKERSRSMHFPTGFFCAPG